MRCTNNFDCDERTLCKEQKREITALKQQISTMVSQDTDFIRKWETMCKEYGFAVDSDVLDAVKGLQKRVAELEAEIVEYMAAIQKARGKEKDAETSRDIEKLMNVELQAQIKAAGGLLAELEIENERYKVWVDDLHSGMYINCVYCGHQYGPSDEVPASMADVLKKHVEQCPKHPMSKLKIENATLRAQIAAAKRLLVEWQETWECDCVHLAEGKCLYCQTEAFLSPATDAEPAKPERGKYNASEVAMQNRFMHAALDALNKSEEADAED